MKLSNGYILGSLGKIVENIKENFEQSILFGFLSGDSVVNDAIDESAVVNMPKLVKEKLGKKSKKGREKTLVGRKPLKRAQERVGAVDAADLPKSFGYVFGGAVRESKIVALVNGIWSNLCNTQASLIGALLLLTSISSFAVSLIKHIVKVAGDADTFSLNLSLVMFVVAIFLVGAGNKSIYELFTQSLIGSEFMKNVMGIRIVEENAKDDREYTTSSSPRTFVVILFCLIICGVSLWAGLERIVAVSLIVAFVVAVLKMPEAGIVILLTAFPWIGMLDHSERWLAVISSLIMVSWLLKLFVGKRVFTVRFVDVTVGVFLLTYMLSGVVAKGSAEEASASVCYFIVGLLYFPISGLIRSGEWVNRCMRAYTVGTLIVSFTGLTQFIVRNIFLGGDIVFGITAVFSSNHSLCAYLLVGVFIGLFNLSVKDDHEFGISFKISLALNLICIVLAGSKTAYVALLVALFVYLLIQKTKVIAFVLLLTPALVVVWFMLPDAVTSHVGVLLQSTDLELRSKMYIWNCIVDRTQDHLLFGIGTGVTSLKAVWSDCEAYLPATFQFYSLYISVVVQVGVVGFVWFVSFLISAVQRGFSVVANSGKDTYFRSLSASAVTAMISLLTFGMGNSLWHDVSLFLLFFFIVAMLRCTKEVYVRETSFENEGEILDIDISTQRKRPKENKLLIAVLRVVAKAMKKTKKKKSAVRTKNTAASADSDSDLEKTDTGMEKVQIKEVDLCEEESEWLRK